MTIFLALNSGCPLGGKDFDEPRPGHWFISEKEGPDKRDLLIGMALFWPAQEMTIRQGSRTLDLRSNDIALITRTCPDVVVDDLVWKANLLDFGGQSFALRTGLNEPPLSFVLDGNHPLSLNIKSFWTVGFDINQSDPTNTSTLEKLLDLIGHITVRLRSDAGEPRLTAYQRAMLGRANALITANFADPSFTVSALVLMMRITSRQLSSLFFAIGTTTAAAIVDRRLRHAKALLAEPANRRRQIALVARDCGFADPSYFGRCFEQKWGISPRDYRNNLLK